MLAINKAAQPEADGGRQTTPQQYRSNISQLQTALNCLHRGWFPIPLCWPDGRGNCACGRGHTGRDVGKAPLLGKGYQTLRPTEADIRTWWGKWPQANVGVLLEPSGLIFVGPDSPEAQRWVRERGAPPTTVRFSANPGLLYRRPANCPATSTKLLNGQLDIKANGYCVIYGRHRTGADIYLDFIDALTEAPDWVVQLLSKATPTTEREVGVDEPPVRLDTDGMALWRGERAVDLADGRVKPRDECGQIDRSETLFLIGLTLAKAGATKRTIIEALANRDRALGYTKYVDRADGGEEEYTRIAAKVLGPPTGTQEGGRRRSLDEVVAVFQHWLCLPDPAPLLVVLAAVAANYTRGDPVWLLLVAPPSFGKTEILNALTTLPHIYPTGVLTEASLLSGTPSKQHAKDAKGGLLRVMGEFGILLVKDFGGVLSMNRDARGPLLAALREIYDGAWTRHVGIEGGRTLSWRGKCGLVGGATPTIDEHYAVMATLGERFLFFRLPEADRWAMANKALRSIGHEQEMRAELAAAVSDLFQSITLPNEPPDLDDTERDRLIALSILTVQCRSAVTRDNYTHEITLIAGAEGPSRFAKGLLKLMTGLDAIGVPRPQAWQLVEKVALDSMPEIRRRVLKFMINTEGPWATSDIAQSLGYPTNTTRRALEELSCYGIVGWQGQGPGHASLWFLTNWTKEICTRAGLLRNSG